MDNNLISKNLRKEFELFDFHDSIFEKVLLSNESEGNRKCTITINYYNWENNQEDNKPWEWKKLEISFNRLT